jgi:hypothetical protein
MLSIWMPGVGVLHPEHPLVGQFSYVAIYAFNSAAGAVQE